MLKFLSACVVKRSIVVSGVALPVLSVPVWTHYPRCMCAPVAVVHLTVCVGLCSYAELLAACDSSDMVHQSSSTGQWSPGVLNGQPVMVRWLQLTAGLYQQQLHERLNEASALQHPHIVPVVGGSLEQGGAVVYDLTQVCVDSLPLLATVPVEARLFGTIACWTCSPQLKFVSMEPN